MFRSRSPRCGQPVVIEPEQKIEAAVVWLHGMMDNPEHWVHALQELRTPASWKWVLLRSPQIPITYLDGKAAAAWGDFKETTALHVGSGDHEDVDCILPEAVAEVHAAIQALQTDDGLPPERIAVAGFSQGAALAAEAVLTFPQPLAGQALLCGWLTPGARSVLPMSGNSSIPTFLGHSKADMEVEFDCAQFSHDSLADFGAPVKLQVVRNLDHIPAAHKMFPAAIQFIAEILGSESQSYVKTAA